MLCCFSNKTTLPILIFYFLFIVKGGHKLRKSDTKVSGPTAHEVQDEKAASPEALAEATQLK
jgi:hypothetical protein